MDTLNFDTFNILLNGQPYPLNSVRPQYPTVPGDNTAVLLFPWWQSNALWSGDVRMLINGQTGMPFVGISDFMAFCNAYFYTSGTSALTYLGTWDASTNTPTLANGTGTSGDFYITSVAGTVDFGAGSITFAVGDHVVYNGTIWQDAPGIATPSLQQVTDVGNTTTDAVAINNELYTQVMVDAPAGVNSVDPVNRWLLANDGSTLVDYSTPGTLSVNGDLYTEMVVDASGGVNSIDPVNRLLLADDASTLVNYSAPGALQVTTELQVLDASSNPGVDLQADIGSGAYVNIYSFSANNGASMFAGAAGAGWSLSDNSGADTLTFNCPTLSGSGANTVGFRATSGTVALLSDVPVVGAGNFSVTGTTGATSYTIPHGLPFTPVLATVVAKNADTATLLAGSYYLAYDATNIVVTLLAATVGTPSINLDWIAAQ